MNFKEALIAHLHGEKVEARLPGSDKSEEWDSFLDKHGNWNYSDDWKLCLLNGGFDEYRWEFRLAPRTITVNGVEVPAPESEVPSAGSVYYIPCISIEELYKECVNHCKSIAKRHIYLEILYLNKEDAIARAKAMLITSQKD